MIGPIIGGLASIGGTIASALGQRATNVRQQKLAAKQMKFQEKMSSSAFSRRVQDIKSTGMNPMLAISGGAASAPPGAMAVTANPAAAAPQGMANAVGSTISALQVRQQLRNMKAQERLTQAQQFKEMQDGLLKAQEVTALGQKLPGMGDLDNVKNLLVRLQASTARQALELNRAGRVGKEMGLDAWSSFIKLLRSVPSTLKYK